MCIRPWLWTVTCFEIEGRTAAAETCPRHREAASPPKKRGCSFSAISAKDKAIILKDKATQRDLLDPLSVCIRTRTSAAEC